MGWDEKKLLDTCSVNNTRGAHNLFVPAPLACSFHVAIIVRSDRDRRSLHLDLNACTTDNSTADLCRGQEFNSIDVVLDVLKHLSYLKAT